MERQVPKVASEKIELYLRTVYSLLRSTAEVNIGILTESHAGMNSLLHPHARDSAPDMSAFNYSILRLPPEIPDIGVVILGQSEDIFLQAGIVLDDWQEVIAPARRRRSFYDGEKRLAVMIASRSDIDDLIPLMTAYEIEWNKMHRLFRMQAGVSVNDLDDARLADILQLPLEDVERLRTIWGDRFKQNLALIAERECKLRVQLLNGSLTEYMRAIHGWWHGIAAAAPDVEKKPVYFISSNLHSLINILTGYALHHEEELIEFVERGDDDHLKEEWVDIQDNAVPSSRENFFYYVLKKYMATKKGKHLAKERREKEKECGIIRVGSGHSFDIQAQVIPLSGLNLGKIDGRLKDAAGDFLQDSDALILNIDYPLGLAAYQVLSEVAQNTRNVLGVYIIGKAAILNGTVGDVMIPNVVYDGHSRNTYMFSNSLAAQDVTPYLVYGNVLDNQKAVTVRGTFLQNNEYMGVFYREGYTDIEMEGGPYLSAVYEMFRPKRYPTDEIVNLYNLPFDLGMAHYASDKPLGKGKNLGAASLSYFGMDPTYATNIAVLKRIFELEKIRLEG